MSGARTLLYVAANNSYAVLERNEFLELPGGKRRRHETALDTAIREFEEETNIQLAAASLTPLGYATVRYGSRGAFRQDIFAGYQTTVPAHASAVLWVPKPDILAAPLQPEIMHFLKRAQPRIDRIHRSHAARDNT